MTTSQLVDEFYNGTAEKDWPCWAIEAVAHLEGATDHNRLVRELDVLLNGEAGAAKQASLCDIVAQVRREGIRSIAGQADRCNPTRLNMNVMTSVTLTVTGARIYNEWMAQFPASSRALAQPGDTLHEPLWQLFQMFGASLFMGMREMPFAQNAVELSAAGGGATA